jgi:heterodisulfide reductase subunit A
MAMRTGVFICSCGPNIGDRMDIERLAEEAAGMTGVVLSETYGLLCSPKGREYLAEKIRENHLDRVVVAACSPREHESTFMDVCRSAGLNPFMMEMANIREQVAWVTSKPDEATRKALNVIRSAVYRIKRHTPLQTRSIVCNPEVMVVGGGIAGMTASLVLADADRRVTLLEREQTLGGERARGRSGIAGRLADQVSGRSEINVVTGGRLLDAVGFFGNFIVRLEGQEQSIGVGSIVFATGCRWNGPEPSPSEGFEEMAGMLRVPLDERGFPAREHGSLAPVSTPIDGIHFAGCAGGPCSLQEAVRSAEAVAGTILSTLVPGRQIATEPRTSVISETLCIGCRTCMDVCGFGAVSYLEEKNVCQVNGVLCKGCGNCAAACPSGAIRSMHFTPDQIRFQMEGALG